MTYQELCKMIIALCDQLFIQVIEEEERDETSISIGATLRDTQHIEITIVKREMDGDTND